MKQEVAAAQVTATDDLLVHYAKDYFPKLFKEIEELQSLCEELYMKYSYAHIQNNKLHTKITDLEDSSK